MSQPNTALVQGNERDRAPSVPQRRRRDWFPFWLIVPTVVALLAIQVYPALYTLVLSLQTRRPAGWQFVGLRNFSRLFSSRWFVDSVGHTVIFLAGYTALTLAIGLAIALLLNYKTRWSSVYLTLLFIPWALADIIVGVVFQLLVLPDYGILSGILQNPALFPPNGLSVLTADAPPPWISWFPFPPSPAMIYLILASVWRALPFTTLLLLAALQTISNEVIESATIDGASAWQVVRHVTVPLIRSTVVVALFNLTLSGMNGVGTVFSLTGGGPGTSTTVISYLLYDIGWQQLDYGGAAALALMMGAINLALIIATLRITRVERASD